MHFLDTSQSFGFQVGSRAGHWLKILTGSLNVYRLVHECVPRYLNQLSHSRMAK